MAKRWHNVLWNICSYSTVKLFVTQMSNYFLVISFQLMFYKTLRSSLARPLFLRLSYVSAFVQQLAYIEKKPLFPPLSIRSRFHLRLELGLFWNTRCCYRCPKFGLISQETGLFFADLETTKQLTQQRQRFGQIWRLCYAEREVDFTLFCKETKVAKQWWWKFLRQNIFFVNFREIDTKPNFVLTWAYFALGMGWLKINVETNLGPQIYMYLSTLAKLRQKKL